MRPKIIFALAAVTAALVGAPAARAGDQEADVSALWSVTPGGQREVVASPGGLDAGAHGTWSPDGRQIAFVRFEDAAGMPTDFGRLVVKAADTSEAETTLATGVGAIDSGPVWSPTGDRIAYIDRGGDIRTVAPTGGRPKLVARAGYAEHLRWSPDGKSIVYVDDYYSGCRQPHKLSLTNAVFVVTVDGARTRLTKTSNCNARGTTDELPVWAGNGTVAFVREIEDVPNALPISSAVYTVQVQGAHRLRKLRVPTPHTWEVLGGDLVPSPDGRTLAIEFAPFTYHLGNLVYGEPHELWLLPVDGSEPKQLPLRPFEGAGPAFAPDGAVTICGGSGVIRIDAETRKRRLISRYDGCVAGAWAPDGSRFLVLADLSN